MAQIVKHTITEEQLAIVKEKYMVLSRTELAKLIGISQGKLSNNMFFAGLRKNELLAKRAFEENKEGFFSYNDYPNSII